VLINNTYKSDGGST